MIKAIIFDLDGVISDTEILHNKAEKAALSDAGIHVDKKELHKYSGVMAKIFFKEILKKHKKSSELEKVIENKKKILINLVRKQFSPILGSVELIKNLYENGFKLAVATSSSRKYANIILSKLKIENYFDAVLTSENITHSKPHPEIFLLASRRIGIKPKECLVIEDSKSGVIAAKKAGMKCVGFKSKNSGNQDLSKADLIIDNLRKLNIDKIKSL